MADGSIRIDTRLNTEPLKKDMAEVNKALTNGLNDGGRSKALQKDIEKLDTMTQKAAKSIENAFENLVPDDSVKGIERYIASLQKLKAAAEAQQGALKARIDKEYDSSLTFTDPKMQAANNARIAEQVAPLTKQYEELGQKIQAIDGIVEEFNGELNELKATEQGVAALEDSLSGDKYLSKIQTEEQYQAELAQTRAQLEAIEAEADQIAQTNGISRDAVLSQSGAYQTLLKRLQLLESNAERYLGVHRRSTQEIREQNRQLQKLDHKMGGVIKKISKIAVNLLGVRAVYSLLSRIAQQYLSDNEALANNIKSVWGTLGEMLAPAIQTVVNWIMKAIGYLNVFYQALTGINAIANYNAKALQKQAKATAGAGAAAAKAKAQLAGFDEMNKLSDDSSAGGGGGGANSAFTGFETPELDPEFVKALEWLGEHLKTILITVGLIALGLKLWQLSTKLTGALVTMAGILLAIAGAVALVYGFLDAWNNGLDWDNLTIMLAGIAAIVGGLAIAFGAVAAAIGAIVGGIMLIIAGIKSWVEDDKNAKALAAIETGLLAIGIALGVLVSWWALLIAAIVGAVVAVIMYWDEICAAFETGWQWVEENIIAPLADFFAPLLTAAEEAWAWLEEKVFNPLKEAFNAVKEWIKTYIVEPIEDAKEVIKVALLLIWDKIKEIFTAIWEVVKALAGAFKTYIWDPIKEKIIEVWAWLKEKLFNPIKEFLKKAASWIYDKVLSPIIDKFLILKEKFLAIFKKVAIAVGEFISGTIKSVVNGALSLIENTINLFIRGLNGAIGIVNKIPNVNISTVQLLSLPRLAQGGIVNNPTRGVPLVAGEAGAEAILPLENNTEWMDILAEKINTGDITIPIMLDGKVIAKYLISLQQKRAFVLNGGL